MILLEILGMRYPLNNLTRKYKFGLYQCKCGNTFEKRITKSLLKSNCASCAKSIIRTHGKTGTRLYNIWCNMKNRCSTNSTKHKSHQRYMDNGITVCIEWSQSFEVFQNWALNNGYQKHLSIDRKDGTKSYYPENCRWATDALQAQNTKILNSTNTTGYRGVGKNKNRKKFGVQIRVEGKRIWLGAFTNALEGAKVYDQYIKDHNLNHTPNGVL